MACVMARQFAESLFQKPPAHNVWWLLFTIARTRLRNPVPTWCIWRNKHYRLLLPRPCRCSTRLFLMAPHSTFPAVGLLSPTMVLLAEADLRALSILVGPWRSIRRKPLPTTRHHTERGRRSLPRLVIPEGSSRSCGRNSSWCRHPTTFRLSSGHRCRGGPAGPVKCCTYVGPSTAVTTRQ